MKFYFDYAEFEGSTHTVLVDNKPMTLNDIQIEYWKLKYRRLSGEKNLDNAINDLRWIFFYEGVEQYLESFGFSNLTEYEINWKTDGGQPSVSDC